MLVGLPILEAWPNHWVVLLLDLFRLLSTYSHARRPTVHPHGGLVVVFNSPIYFPPVLGYVVLEINQFAAGIYA